MWGGVCGSATWRELEEVLVGSEAKAQLELWRERRLEVRDCEICFSETLAREKEEDMGERQRWRKRQGAERQARPIEALRRCAKGAFNFCPLRGERDAPMLNWMHLFKGFRYGYSSAKVAGRIRGEGRIPLLLPKSTIPQFLFFHSLAVWSRLLNGTTRTIPTNGHHFLPFPSFFFSITARLFQIEMDQLQVKSEARKEGEAVQLDTLTEELSAQIVREIRSWALVGDEEGHSG